VQQPIPAEGGVAAFRLLLSNKMVLGASGILILFHLIFEHAPFMNLWFDFVPLEWRHWPLALSIGLLAFVRTEAEKAVHRLLGYHPHPLLTPSHN